MKNHRVRLVAAVILASGGSVVACSGGQSGGPGSSGDASVDSTSDAQLDTATPPDGSRSDASDAGLDSADDAPFDAGLDGDALDAAAEAGSIWAFNGYCGDAATAACPPDAPCPAFDGGVPGEPCTPTFGRCIGTPSNVEAGLDKIFACLPTGKSVWELDDLCAPYLGTGTNCLDAGVALCGTFDGGIPGQECSPALSRCTNGGEKIFVCEPGGALVWAFNGYCGIGPTMACPAVAACAASDAGVSGSACATEFARCVENDQIFACVQR